jgi:hypothetical protein
MKRTNNISQSSAKWHTSAPIFGLGLYVTLCDAGDCLSS